MRRGHLISANAQKTLEESDAQRAKAREGASEKSFRRNFISSYAQQVEMIRRGAIVTEVDEVTGQPIAFAMPDNKPIPTPAQARRTIWWAYALRPFRNFFSRLTRWVRKVFGVK